MPELFWQEKKKCIPSFAYEVRGACAGVLHGAGGIIDDELSGNSVQRQQKTRLGTIRET